MLNENKNFIFLNIILLNIKINDSSLHSPWFLCIN